MDYNLPIITGSKISHPSEIIKSITYEDLKGASVMFINMPLREDAAPTTTPQGPLLMATNLRDNYGVNANVVDLNGYRIKDNHSERRGLSNGRYLNDSELNQLMGKHLEVYGSPDLVAFSGMITTLYWQEKMAKMVKKISPESFIVSGGGLATELREGLFNYVPELDGVATSEGDDIIVKIMRDAKLVKNRGLESVLKSGLLNPYHIGEYNGKNRLVYSGDRPLDLDVIPFADLSFLIDANGYSVLEDYLNTAVWGKAANNSSATPFTMDRSTTFVSSRGCPYSCDFCYKGTQGGRNYGMRSAENVADEFKEHKEKHGVDFIGIPDDNFGVVRTRIEELVPLLKPLGIRWGTHLRLDEAADLKGVSGEGEVTFQNPKRVKWMAEAGCVYIGYGAESASPAVLESMKKGGFMLRDGLEEKIVSGEKFTFPISMIHGIENSKHAGIHSNCTWIMGYPEETLADLKTSIAFILWQQEFYSQFGESDSVNRKMFTATAYPGTPMFTRPDIKKKLLETFGVQFDSNDRPICDENFRNYVLNLDDATKVLADEHGNPLNYGAMDQETFLQAREHIDNDMLEKVLEM